MNDRLAYEFLSQNFNLIQMGVDTPEKLREFLRKNPYYNVSKKKVSKLPKNFEWEKYLIRNFDLAFHGIEDKESCETHYLENLQNEYVIEETQTRHIKFNKTEKIFLFYHVFCKNDWFNIVKEQVGLIFESDLIKNVDKFYINVIGDDESIKEIQSLVEYFSFIYPLNNEVNEKIEISKILNEFEFPTIEKLIEVSKDSKFFGLYFHTKSSSYPSTETNKHKMDFWRHFMNYQLIKKWEICYEYLKENDLVGTLFKKGNTQIDDYWKNHSKNKNSNSNKHTDHFSGNFFWFTSDYFKKYDEINDEEKINRFNAEWLPFKYKPKHYTIYTDLGYWKSEIKKLKK